jgi:hypothetical protein
MKAKNKGLASCRKFRETALLRACVAELLKVTNRINDAIKKW